MANPSQFHRSLTGAGFSYQPSPRQLSSRPTPAKSFPSLPTFAMKLERSPPILRRAKKPTNTLDRQDSRLPLEPDCQPDLKPEVTRTQITHKSAKQVMQELKLLESRGLKSTVGEVARLNPFSENTDVTKNKGLSVTDLWGPNYTKKSLIAVGMYEAFKKLESRDTRQSIAREASLTARYLPRLVDDLSTMRLLNVRKSRPSMSLFDCSPSSLAKTSTCSPCKASPITSYKTVSTRVRNLEGIMDSCTQLAVENRDYLKQLIKTKFSSKQKTRRVKSDT